jgi:hypothetical protein
MIGHVIYVIISIIMWPIGIFVNWVVPIGSYLASAMFVWGMCRESGMHLPLWFVIPAALFGGPFAFCALACVGQLIDGAQSIDDIQFAATLHMWTMTFGELGVGLAAVLLVLGFFWPSMIDIARDRLRL